jgi:hypothetical protein
MQNENQAGLYLGARFVKPWDVGVGVKLVWLGPKSDVVV